MKKHITKKQTTVAKSNHLKKINPLAVGIDVGADSVFVCAGLPDGQQLIREFSTFTADLNAMVEWLKELKSGSVAMESTGVYWIPPYDILAKAGFKVLLVDARILKMVPGRKTDVNDCQWIQQLHSYGLLRSAFRPDDMGVEFRGYVRQQSRLIEAASTQIQLMHKALTQMNIQLRQVLSNIAGVTGMQIIRAIVGGERDASVLAKYRDSRCKSSKEEIIKSLEGNYRSELVFTLQQSLEGYDFFNKQIIECEQKITDFLTHWELKNNDTIQPESNTENIKPKTVSEPFNSQQMIDNLKKILNVDLTKIPGISINSAVKIIAEIGTNMSCWETSKNFASWMGLCPGSNISGGKIISSKTKPTANKVAQVLRLAANSLYRSKTALGGFLRRMKVRIGAPAAITATAHKLAEIIYTMISRGKEFKETGEAAYERRHQDRVLAKMKRKAAEMGYTMVKTEPQTI